MEFLSSFSFIFKVYFQLIRLPVHSDKHKLFRYRYLDPLVNHTLSADNISLINCIPFSSSFNSKMSMAVSFHFEALSNLHLLHNKIVNYVRIHYICNLF